MNHLTAVIPAAGSGSRIGKPKWQLQYQGKNFLDIIIQKLLATSIKNIICVHNPQSIPEHKSCDFVVNSNFKNGMLSSIYCGIQYDLRLSPNRSNSYLIFPVDHPFVALSTIVALKNEFCCLIKMITCPEDKFNRNYTIVPTYEKKAGHPIIISNSLAEKITPQYFALGLKKFLQVQNSREHKVSVSDRGILQNINTLHDLEKITAIA